MNRCFRYLTALSLVSGVALGISSEAQAQVNLPFLEDWEGTNGETYSAVTASLAGAPEWSYEPLGPTGRLRLAAGAGFYAGGSHAATMDASATGLVANHLTLTLDMTNYTVPQDNIVLDFQHAQHGDEAHANDRVWVRGSSTDPYVELFNVTAGQPSSGTFAQVIDADISAALVGAGQQFSSTFQVRFGQEDDFGATSPTGTDGRTYDNIVLRRVLNNDLTIQDITMPADQSCGQTMQDVEIILLNTGAVTQSNIPVQVDITGDITASFNMMVAGPLAKNQTTNVVLGQINTYPGVNLNITAQVMLANDDDTANDTLAVSRTVKPTEITLTEPAAVCPSDSAQIVVQSEPLASFELYDAETGGTLLDTGDTLNATPVDVTTTFWVERINATLAGGAADNAIGMGAPYGSFDSGTLFNVMSPSIIQSVFVYPSSTGLVQVQVLDSSDNVIGTSAVYQVQAADVDQKTEIEVNIPVPVGSGYKIDAVGTTTALYRNIDGATYPYSISTWIDITGNTPNLPGAYYFFYDWQVSENVPVCSSERTPVDVTVDLALCSADVVVDVAGPESADPGETVEYVTTVTNNGPNSAFAVSVDMPTPAGLTFVSNAGDCANAWPCDLGDVASGSALTITSQYTVDDDFGGTATFSATATSSSSEGSPGDESDSVDLTVMGMGSGGAGGMAAGTGGAAASTTATTTTTTTGSGGSGGGGETGDDEGCSCRAAGSAPANGNWAWLMAGLALVGIRRRRRDA